jgi:hypothetical protein
MMPEWRKNFAVAAVVEAKVDLPAEAASVCGRVGKLARISHSGVDFRVAERERTGEHMKKVAVVG